MNGDQGRCFGEMENRVAEDKIVAEFVGKKKSRKQKRVSYKTKVGCAGVTWYEIKKYETNEE